MTNNGRLWQTAPLLLPALMMMVGIVAGQHVDLSMCWLLFVTVLVCAAVLYRWPLLQSAAIMLAVAALGSVRSATVRQQHDQVTWSDETVSYEAVVVSEVSEKPKTMAMDVVIAGDGRKLKCYLSKDEASRRLRLGDRLQLRSRIEPNSEWHRGTFDYRRYLEVHGFSGRTFVRSGNWRQLSCSWQGLSYGQRMKLHFLSYRHRLLGRLRQAGAAGEEYAVLAAMTLGDRSAMTGDLRDVFAVSGASHVLALSGLHLGIIYMLLTIVTVGRRFRLALQTAVVVAIWAFVLLVGMPVSVVRSAVMISVYALLSLTGRRRLSLNALGLSALLILTFSPDSLYDVGFQLSFASMLAILMVQPVLEAIVSRAYLFDKPLLRWLWGLTTVSVAAQIGTAPLVAYYFGRLPTYFLLTNFIVIPATTLIIALAMATLVVPEVGTVLLMVVSRLNSVLALIATSLPCPSVEHLRPSALQTALVYIIIVSLYKTITIYDKRC